MYNYTQENKSITDHNSMLHYQNQLSFFCHAVPIILFYSTIGSAQTIPGSTDSLSARSITQIIIDDVINAMEDGISYFSVPLHFSKNDWLSAAGLFGTTAAALTVDESIDNMVRRNYRPPLFYNGAYYASKYGRVIYAALFASSFYITGLLAGEDNLRVTGRLLIEAMGYAGTLSLALQVACGRDRPYADKGAWSFRGFQMKDDNQAFPSGHMTIAFAVSSVLAERVNHPIARIGFYTAATVSALALIYRNQHWTSDIIFGSTLGLVSGLYVCSLEETRHGKRTSEQCSFYIFPSPDGIQFVYRF